MRLEPGKRIRIVQWGDGARAKEIVPAASEVKTGDPLRFEARLLVDRLAQMKAAHTALPRPWQVGTQSP